MQKSILKLISLTLLLTFLSGNFSMLSAQTKRKTKVAKKTEITAKSNETKPSDEILTSETNATLSQAWQSGQLPQPLPLPGGDADEAIRVLAQKVAAKNSESIPALLTALQLSGFFITNKDGSTFLAPPDGKGQGLVINGWEIAAAAKMLGENRAMPLKDLQYSLEAVKVFAKADAGNRIIKGLRENADNQRNPFLRAWARFVIELGKNSQTKYDLAKGAKVENVTLDAVQNLLIMRRLYGDLFALAEKKKTATRGSINNRETMNRETQFVRASYSKSSNIIQNTNYSNYGYSEIEPYRFAPNADEKQIPCKLDGDAPIVLDAAATALGYGYGELMGYLGDALEDTAIGGALEKYNGIIGIANLILTYAKFLQTYASLETKLTLEDGAPLVRTKNSTPGARKTVRADVRFNIGNWQMYNCFRTAINLVGIDFATVNDGPAGGVGVTFHLDEGGAGDVYSNSGGLSGKEQIVGLTQGGGRIQEVGTSAGGANSVGSAVYMKTDGDGAARIILEGSPQKNVKVGKLTAVMKQAKIRTTIKLKTGDLKGELGDVIGQGLGGVTGMLTMPLEMLYRVSWISTATLTVPVTDWEECDGGWRGTITYTKITETHGNNGYSKWDTANIYRATFNVKETSKPELSGGIYNMPGLGIMGSIFLEGEVDAEMNNESTTSEKNTSKDFCKLTLKGAKDERTVTCTGSNSVTEEAEGSGDAQVMINFNQNKFRISLDFPQIFGIAKRSGNKNCQNTCLPYKPITFADSKPIDNSRESAFSTPDITFDPQNLDRLSGTTTKTLGDVTYTITYNLSRCGGK